MILPPFLRPNHDHPRDWLRIWRDPPGFFVPNCVCLGTCTPLPCTCTAGAPKASTFYVTWGCSPTSNNPGNSGSMNPSTSGAQPSLCNRIGVASMPTHFAQHHLCLTYRGGCQWSCATGPYYVYNPKPCGPGTGLNCNDPTSGCASTDDLTASASLFPMPGRTGCQSSNNVFFDDTVDFDEDQFTEGCPYLKLANLYSDCVAGQLCGANLIFSLSGPWHNPSLDPYYIWDESKLLIVYQCGSFDCNAGGTFHFAYAGNCLVGYSNSAAHLAALNISTPTIGTDQGVAPTTGACGSHWCVLPDSVTVGISGTCDQNAPCAGTCLWTYNATTGAWSLGSNTCPAGCSCQDITKVCLPCGTVNGQTYNAPCSSTPTVGCDTKGCDAGSDGRQTYCGGNIPCGADCVWTADDTLHWTPNLTCASANPAPCGTTSCNTPSFSPTFSGESAFMPCYAPTCSNFCVWQAQMSSGLVWVISLSCADSNCGNPNCPNCLRPSFAPLFVGEITGGQCTA